VAEQVIRRRYIKGARNFFNLYQPLSNSWVMYDNSLSGRIRRIASGSGAVTEEVLDENLWIQFQAKAR
jgi:predicted ABC-type ATPase